MGLSARILRKLLFPRRIKKKGGILFQACLRSMKASEAEFFNSFLALVAIGRNDPDVQIPGGGEDLERQRDGPDDTGAGGMREEAAGDFRRANRLPGGRRTGGEPAGKDVVRLSVSTGMHRGEEVRDRLLQFGVGLFGTSHAVGTRCGSRCGVQTRGTRETPRLAGYERYQDQGGLVAWSQRRLPRTLPS